MARFLRSMGALVATAVAASAEWDLVLSSAPWGERGHFAAVMDADGAMIVTGGMMVSNNSYHSDTWRSEDMGVSWTLQTQAAPWSPRHRHGAVLLNGCVHVFGGTAGKAVFNDVWKSCDGGKSWTCVTADADWRPREGFGFVVVNETLVMIGGTFGQVGPDTSEVWSTTDGQHWELVANNSFSERFAMTAAVSPAGEIFIAGGTRASDVWVSADSGRTWEARTAQAAWTPRMYSGLAYVGKSLMIFGGQSLESTLRPSIHDTWASEDGGSTWHQLKAPPQMMAARGGMGIVVSHDGNLCYQLGGNSELFPHKDFADIWSIAVDQFMVI